MSRSVRDVPSRGRYEIEVDGELVGFAEYTVEDERVAFTHTEIEPAHGGQGLGGELVGFALDDVRARGLQVLPLCSFVRRAIVDDPDRYLGLVPAPERSRFDL